MSLTLLDRDPDLYYLLRDTATAEEQAYFGPIFARNKDREELYYVELHKRGLGRDCCLFLESHIVKNQLNCGMCWSIAPTETAAYAYYLTDESRGFVGFSANEIHDSIPIADRYVERECHGHLSNMAFEHMKQHGAVLESLRPFKSEKFCYRERTIDEKRSAVFLTGYEILNTDEYYLMGRVISRPFTAGIMANEQFRSLRPGEIYRSVPDPENEQHSVTILGFGEKQLFENAYVRFWWFRNSHGFEFGDKGCGRIIRWSSCYGESESINFPIQPFFELPGKPAPFSSSKQAHRFSGDQQAGGRKNISHSGALSWGQVGGGGRQSGGVVQKVEKLCALWVRGECSFGDRCKYLHSWCTGECFTLLTQLEGHQKSVTGISMSSQPDKLYSGSKDETVRVWDFQPDKLYSGSKDETVRGCDLQSKQCAKVNNFGGEVGCMLSEGPWLCVGLPNFVKVMNTQTDGELNLESPFGKVYALAVANDLLFAGTQNGTILAWRFNADTKCFDPPTSLQGHTLSVVTLVVGGIMLYSGSMDNSIRVWNLETLQCLQTLSDHTSAVMSLLCWDQFLLSCSLDNTIKVWVAVESGNLEVTYTHTEEHGLLTFCGMHDSETKPVLLCSCNDNCVRAYDLPSFSERGKIYATQEVQTIQKGPRCLFFTGDGTGQVRVWKWLAQPAATLD